MFGTKQYKEKKQKMFTNENERKRFFAIKNYYDKKAKNDSYTKQLKRGK